MNHPFVAIKLDWDTRLDQPGSVSIPFIAKRVKAGRDDVRRGQPLEVLCL